MTGPRVLVSSLLVLALVCGCLGGDGGPEASPTVSATASPEPSATQPLAPIVGDVPPDVLRAVLDSFPDLRDVAGEFNDKTVNAVEDAGLWYVNVHWGFCEDCYCIFTVHGNGTVEKSKESNCPATRAMTPTPVPTDLPLRSLDTDVPDNVLDAIRGAFPDLESAVGDLGTSGVTGLEEPDGSWLVNVHWGRCEDCYCDLTVHQDGTVERGGSGNCPFSGSGP